MKLGVVIWNVSAELKSGKKQFEIE